ncbi:hypothetical protein K466DRAFT_650737 [Polyporus arcularius HHB13444]|uniref:Uncharacterized protein n=1 Tax=Polyporus arcularius HHB13444 TaxID=1314778 RepID=A0A5C3PS09_9APHY|nr:hypothetical protein K466DRAFT_650737 [Polyporus arcularius HHB13444]
MSILHSSAFDALNARLALRYLRWQLSAGHEAANDLYSTYKSIDVTKVSEEERIAYAWAVYSTKPRGNDPSTVLRFDFSTPTVRFLCDHDALLELNVTTLARGENEVSVATNWSIAYRVTSEWRAIVGNDSKVGEHESRIRMLVFDFEQAVPVRMPTDSWFNDNYVERHLSTYLRNLQYGGRHVLFVPPEFDAFTLYSPIYFSLSDPADEYGKAPEYPLSDINGYTAEMIDQYLSLLWYTCSFIAREHKDTQAIWRASLAEFRTWKHKDYSSDWHACLKFGAAKVQILCSREVVLHFPLSAVTFYQKDEPLQGDFAERDTPDYIDWTIAVVVKVTANAAAVRVDASSGRCSFRYSQFTTAPKPEHIEARRALIAFFSEQYINIVGRSRLQYLFYRLQEEHIRAGWGAFEESDGSWWMLERNARFGRATILDSTIRETKMCGFDVVVAVSQNSINMHLRNGLQAIRDFFPRWESEDLVMDVKSVTVRLRDQRKAILLVNIVDGYMNALLNSDFGLDKETTPVQFGSCSIAFEVDLAEKKYNVPNKGFSMHEIYLDVENAELSAAGTNFTLDFYHGDGRGNVQNTLIDLVLKTYLKSLKDSDVHIVARVPEYGINSSSFYKMTSMDYFTYAPGSVFDEAESELSEGRSEAMLFVVGMTGKHALPPREVFVPSHRWIVNASSSFSQGTFAVAGQTFNMRLNALLANINKITTLACTNARSKSATVEDMVQQWATYSEYQDRPCAWSPIGHADADRYEWKYIQKWQFHEEGTQAIVRGDYSITCSTENLLELPDITLLSNGSLEFRMSGAIKLRIASTANDHSWSTESTATWEATVSVKTTGQGAVKVEIADTVTHPPPKLAGFRRTSANMPDAYKILQAHLPTKAQFRETLKELQDLEGPWEYYWPGGPDTFTLCSPTFNADGDLLFELRRSSHTMSRQQRQFSRSTPGGRPADVPQTKPVANAAGNTESRQTAPVPQPTAPVPPPTAPVPPPNAPPTPSTTSTTGLRPEVGRRTIRRTPVGDLGL